MTPAEFATRFTIGLDGQWGFHAIDHENQITVYAYPSSDMATKARAIGKDLVRLHNFGIDRLTIEMLVMEETLRLNPKIKRDFYVAVCAGAGVEPVSEPRRP